jgi:hypothetical protein
VREDRSLTDSSGGDDAESTMYVYIPDRAADEE